MKGAEQRGRLRLAPRWAQDWRWKSSLVVVAIMVGIIVIVEERREERERDHEARARLMAHASCMGDRDRCDGARQAGDSQPKTVVS